MKHARNLIIVLVFAGCLALMLGIFVAATAVAQDTTKSEPAKTIPDSLKAIIQAGAPAPIATEKDAIEEDKPSEAEAGSMEKKDASPATGEESAPEKTTEKVTKEESTPVTKPEEKSKPAAEPEDPTAPYKSVKFDKGEKPVVVMETSMGTITIELWPDVAPMHCQSFVHLINKGFYDSLMFHRIVPGFVIQGGDPLGNGTGGPGYNVPAEFSNKPHEDGILSMARSTDPNSAGSQFFICLGRLASLDNKYTVFGKVIEGLDVAHKIEKAPAQKERPTTPVLMTKVYMKGAE